MENFKNPNSIVPIRVQVPQISVQRLSTITNKSQQLNQSILISKIELKEEDSIKNTENSINSSRNSLFTINNEVKDSSSANIVFDQVLY